MKKIRNILLSIVSLSIFLSSLVSAGPVQGVNQLLSGTVDVIGVIIRFFLNAILEINSIDEFLFGKIIFLVLIYLVVYVVINKNEFFGKKNSAIIKIITAAISILAVRFMPEELIRIIFLQYSALGAAIGMFIPFIIMLFFLHQSDFGPLPRKIGWFIYGISYVAIFSYTYTDLTGIAGYIYWAGIIGIIVAFFFDSQIHAAFGSAEIRQAKREFEISRLSKFRQELRELIRYRDDPGITQTEKNVADRRIAYTQKQIYKIQKSL